MTSGSLTSQAEELRTEEPDFMHVCDAQSPDLTAVNAASQDRM